MSGSVLLSIGRSPGIARDVYSLNLLPLYGHLSGSDLTKCFHIDIRLCKVHSGFNFRKHNRLLNNRFNLFTSVVSNLFYFAFMVSVFSLLVF